MKKVVILFLVGLVFANILSASFEYSVIDSNNNGRRAIGDIDGDGRNDIVVHTWGSNRGSTADGTLVWYKYPNWEKTEIRVGKNYFGDEIQAYDLDNDGDIDIVAPVGNENLADVYFYENVDGVGTQWNEIKIGTAATNSEVKDLHIKDVDNDGKLDVVVRTKDKVVVFYQNRTYNSYGEITGINWVNRSSGISPREGSIMGDVDGDGLLDVICNGYWIKNPGGRQNNWQRYDIDKQWYTGQDQLQNWRKSSVRAQFADINGDGEKEVIFSHSEGHDYPVTWYEMTGNPVTQGVNAWIKHEIEVVDFAHTLQVADFNLDGHLDILAAPTIWAGGTVLDDIDPNGDLGDISIFINDGNGRFTKDNSIPEKGKYMYCGIVGDIDDDKDPDIVSSRTWEKSPIEMWRNNQVSELTSLDNWEENLIYGGRKNLSTRPGPGAIWLFGLDAKDITGNGKTEVVAGREFHRLEDSGWTTVNLPGPDSMDCALFVDVDRDNYDDIICFNLDAGNNIYWLKRNDSLGNSWTANAISLSPTIPKPGHKNPQGFALGQLKPGDTPEIVIEAGTYNTDKTTGSAGIFVIEIDHPRTTWRTHKISGNVLSGGNSLAIGDIDGDGKLDVVTGKKNYEPLDIYWFKNPGSLTTTWQSNTIGTLTSKGTRSNGIVHNSADKFAIVDLDGDGRNDVVIAEETYPIASTSSILWYKNPLNPSQSWGSPNILIENQESFNSLDIADMNNDGYWDIVAADMGYTTSGGNTEGGIYIFENNPNQPGTFSTHKIVSDVESHGLIVEDVEGDGLKDIITIAWNHPEASKIRYWSNKNGGTTPDTGIIYKEFSYVPKNGKEYRVTDPDAYYSCSDPNGVKRGCPADFLPNPILNITGVDLTEAKSATAILDFWGGHENTRDKKFNFNGNSWIDIVDIPGKEYMQQATHEVPIPLNYLVSGKNSYTGTCGNNNWGWGQWGWFGTMIRVYYDENKAHPKGHITSPVSGAILNDNPTINIQIDEGNVDRVDVIAYYEGYDTDGDNVYKEWNYDYQNIDGYNTPMEIHNHVGTDTSAPFSVIWDTSWVPNQEPMSIKLKARIRDTSGVWYETPEVTGLTLQRPYSVNLYKPIDVPSAYCPRVGNTKSSSVNIQSLNQATEAKMNIRTWNGNINHQNIQTVKVNNQQVATKFGKDHFYSYDLLNIPLNVLNTGSNTISFYSDTTHHCIEVLWPGPAISVKSSISTITCGNGQCQPDQGESCASCPSDCTENCDPVCGNGICELGENEQNCPEDCIEPEIPFTWHWPFEETSGTSIIENCEKLSPGTLNGASRESSDCKSGKCLNFDGVNDYANLGNLDVSGNEMTISAWFKSSDLANCVARDCRIISKASSTDEQSHYWMISPIVDGSTTKLRFRLKTGGTTSTLIADSGTLSNNVWTHVVATYDGSYMKLYKDGQLIGSIQKTGQISGNSGIPAWIGGNPTDSTIRPWKGKIDEVAIWNKALNNQEVLELYNTNNIICSVSCGNGICETNLGEDCRTCEEDCGQCVFHPADKNEDGCVDIKESVLFIKEKKSGQHSIAEVISALAEMKKGCN